MNSRMYNEWVKDDAVECGDSLTTNEWCTMNFYVLYLQSYFKISQFNYHGMIEYIIADKIRKMFSTIHTMHS